jgi:hypothetical protein
VPSATPAALSQYAVQQQQQQQHRKHASAQLNTLGQLGPGRPGPGRRLSTLTVQQTISSICSDSDSYEMFRYNMYFLPFLSQNFFRVAQHGRKQQGVDHPLPSAAP